MREFFKDIILNLYLYCGNRQAEKLSDEEVDILLNKLCKVCEVHNYMTDQQQKDIVEKRLITDQTYQNINARLIAGWFEWDGKKFFKESAHVEVINLVKQYLDMVKFWQENESLDPKGQRLAFARTNLKRVESGIEPIDDLEAIKILADVYAKQIQGSILEQNQKEIKGNGVKMREQLDQAGVKFDEEKHKKYDPNDTTDLQEMLAEHEALNKKASEEQ